MDKYAPQKKYLKQNQRKMTISFITKTEADILEQIDKQPNKAGYIKRLIREDIAREKSKNL